MIHVLFPCPLNMNFLIRDELRHTTALCIKSISTHVVVIVRISHNSTTHISLLFNENRNIYYMDSIFLLKKTWTLYLDIFFTIRIEIKLIMDSLIILDHLIVIKSNGVDSFLLFGLIYCTLWLCIFLLFIIMKNPVVTLMELYTKG